MKSFSVDWHADYGCEHRRGWSVCIDGISLVEFSRFLIWALIKGLWLAWRSPYYWKRTQAGGRWNWTLKPGRSDDA